MYSSPFVVSEDVSDISRTAAKSHPETRVNQPKNDYGSEQNTNKSTAARVSPVSRPQPQTENLVEGSNVASMTEDRRRSSPIVIDLGSPSNIEHDKRGSRIPSPKMRTPTTNTPTPMSNPNFSEIRLSRHSSTATGETSAEQTLLPLKSNNINTPESEPSTAQVMLPNTYPPKSREKTHIPLWIITREPLYTEEHWKDGKFMGTSLATFIEGISQATQQSHIEKIKLTLRGPTSQTRITVSKDEEDVWAAANRTFLEKLREAKLLARAKGQSEQMQFKILIEPIYAEVVLPNNFVDSFEDEFDF